MSTFFSMLISRRALAPVFSREWLGTGASALRLIKTGAVQLDLVKIPGHKHVVLYLARRYVYKITVTFRLSGDDNRRVPARSTNCHSGAIVQRRFDQHPQLLATKAAKVRITELGFERC